MDEYKLGDIDLGDEKIDPYYKKGVEHGYWLRRGESTELDDIINRSKNHVGYQTGLIHGKREADREKVKERLNEQFGTSPNYDRNIGMD
jgi:hypothetical protein